MDVLFLIYIEWSVEKRYLFRITAGKLIFWAYTMLRLLVVVQFSLSQWGKVPHDFLIISTYRSVASYLLLLVVTASELSPGRMPQRRIFSPSHTAWNLGMYYFPELWLCFKFPYLNCNCQQVFLQKAFYKKWLVFYWRILLPSSHRLFF